MGEAAVEVEVHVVADASSITSKDTLVMEELDTALGVLHIQEDIQKGVENKRTISDDNSSQLLSIHQNNSYSKTHGSLTKCATFPPLGKIQSATNGGDELASATQVEATCSRTMSMPTPRKLVSAMKGSREHQLGLPRLKLNVTWAPDVYDPPATSLSHTVRNYSQRPRGSKKKDQKHKHKHKGKSARGSSSEKKKHHVNKRSINMGADLSQLRSLASPNKPVGSDGFGQLGREVVSGAASIDGSDDQQSEMVPRIKFPDFQAGGQDSKCGSSFRASLAGVHVSVAEATS